MKDVVPVGKPGPEHTRTKEASGGARFVDLVIQYRPGVTLLFNPHDTLLNTGTLNPVSPTHLPVGEGGYGGYLAALAAIALESRSLSDS